MYTSAEDCGGREHSVDRSISHQLNERAEELEATANGEGWQEDGFERGFAALCTSIAPQRHCCANAEQSCAERHLWRVAECRTIFQGK